MQTIINIVKTINRRISKKAQIAILVTKDIKNKLRTIFINVIANI